ncbi:hypothetical protein [Streptomyces europaeiscabiei]|uniref:hypothetical protein n=1 Tax=Streptomyces europaeiscabiei TaxID=146819 RepID=UPI002E160E2F|nr:hypothetical protein OHB30_01720 [Streptomyces europaeiscabiei]
MAAARAAGILVVAAGVAGLIGPEHVRPGATVIHVGVHRTPHGPTGDVHTAAPRRDHRTGQHGARRHRNPDDHRHAVGQHAGRRSGASGDREGGRRTLDTVRAPASTPDRDRSSKASLRKRVPW